MADPYLISFWLQASVATVPILFNMFGICYLLRLPNKRRFHRILLAPVIIDTLFLMATVVINQVYSYNYWSYVLPSIFPYTEALGFCLLYCSFYLTTSLAWERYLSIAHPFLLTKYPLLTRAELYILPSIIISFVGGGPFMFC